MVNQFLLGIFSVNSLEMTIAVVHGTCKKERYMRGKIPLAVFGWYGNRERLKILLLEMRLQLLKFIVTLLFYLVF